MSNRPVRWSLGWLLLTYILLLAVGTAFSHFLFWLATRGSL